MRQKNMYLYDKVDVIKLCIIVVVRGRNAREGKLAPNWKRPYNITASIGKGAYTLETLDTNIVKYFSF